MLQTKQRRRLLTPSLRRAARCLFEIFTTLSVGGTISVCLSTKDRRNFEKSRDQELVADLTKRVEEIDARKARATYLPDWDAIMKTILEAGKLEELNRTVREQVRLWFERESSFDVAGWEQQGRRTQMKEFAGLIRDYRAGLGS